MRVYLNNCCFNRPFGDQRQTRVRLEAEAKRCIQEYIREGTLELAWSYILDFASALRILSRRGEPRLVSGGDIQRLMSSKRLPSFRKPRPWWVRG